MKTISSPTSEEYASFYSDYVQRGTARGNALTALPKQIDEIYAALGQLNNQDALFKFEPAEWSIKEVIGHLNDVERIFSYRLLCISRNDKTPLPGFEQEDYVREAEFDKYPFIDLLNEFEFLRRANIVAINNLSAEAVSHLGTASGASISARSLIYMLVGHVDHHMASLKEKYLPGLK